jgi:hypothetical protein
LLRGEQEVIEEVTYYAGLDLGQVSDFSAFSVVEKKVLRPKEDGIRIVSGEAMGKVIEVDAGPSSPSLRRGGKKVSLTVRHLERFDLGTPYPRIVETILERFEEPPLAGSTLLVDETGVGRPVVDMFMDCISRGVDGTREWAVKKVQRGLVDNRKWLPPDEAEALIQKLLSKKRKLRASLRPITITSGSEFSIHGQGFRVAKKQLASALQVVLQSRVLKVAGELELARVLISEMNNFQVKITTHGNETFEADPRAGTNDDLVLSVAMPVWFCTRTNKEFWMR